MYASYHNHTWRCNHASGTEREYVEQAIAGGLKIFGFSDHTPQLYPGEFYSHSKMRPDQLEDYVNTVLRLKEEYRNEIDIRLGLEVEYYPALWEALLDMTEAYPIEYFLLGQHFLNNEYDGDGIYTGKETQSEEKLALYCDQCSEAMQTGLFSYLAHPDLLHFTGDPDIYEKHMRKLCRAAKAAEIPLEINLLGIRTGRHYPNPVFWKIAGEEGCTAIFGTDAHRPEDVPDHASVPRARLLAEKNGMKVLDELTVRNPRTR